MTIETPPPNGDKGVTAWHGADHSALVTAKGWKGADDVLKSYAELETFRGAPADRLIKLPDPDKIDDAFRTDVFKRIGYNPNRGPEKPEDYGVTFEGAPAEFATGLAAIAHKHGIPKEALAEFAEFNGKFGKEFGEKSAAEQTKADEKTWTERHAGVEGKLKERFGDKYDATTELMTREAMRIGFKDAADLEAFEKTLALGGDEHLLRFRSLLADVADMRREAPLHKGGGATMTPESAAAQLKAKGADQEWVAKALTRGTPEAEENLRLNIMAQGGTVDDDQIKRMARGLTPTPNTSS